MTAKFTAEHIIGLTALETGQHYHDQTDPGPTNTVRRRFQAIRRKGTLIPCNDAETLLNKTGSQRGWDHLAGDHQYVFLSAGPRYREMRSASVTYGFGFDAEQLIKDGALVGPDLLGHYEELAEQIAEHVASTLPTPPPMSDSDIAEFAAVMEITDPNMLRFVQANANDPTPDILRGMQDQDQSIPGVTQALALWNIQVATLQAQKRKQGTEALELLRTYNGDGRLEILVAAQLATRHAHTTIQAGTTICRCRRCGRPLHHPRSIQAGYGPHCRHIIRAS